MRRWRKNLNKGDGNGSRRSDVCYTSSSKKKKKSTLPFMTLSHNIFFFFFNQQLKTPNKTKQKMQTGSTLTIFSHPNVSISAKVFLYCYTRK